MRNDGLDTTIPAPFAVGSEAFQARVASRMAELRTRLSKLSPGTRPTVLELGAGHGHFLASYADAHPGHFCIGIDLISDRVRRATRKRDRAGLDNLHFFQCEATEFLQCLPPHLLFRRIFALFPDPWPKKRHHKNRLLSPSFLEGLAKRSTSGADLFFRTDHRPYFDEVQETVGAHEQWAVDDEALWPFEEQTVFQARAASFSSLVARRNS